MLYLVGGVEFDLDYDKRCSHVFFGSVSLGAMLYLVVGFDDVIKMFSLECDLNQMSGGWVGIWALMGNKIASYLSFDR